VDSDSVDSDPMSSDLLGRTAGSPPGTDDGSGRRGPGDLAAGLTRVAGRPRRLGNQIGVVAGIAILLVVTSSLHPGFLSVASLANIAQAASFFGIMSLGTVFLLAMREMDLSVGSIYGLSIVIAGLLVEHGTNPWVAAIAGIAVATVLGAVNGIIASAFRLPVLIITLGSLTAYMGISAVLTGSQTITLNATGAFFTDLGGTWLRVPVMVYAFVFLAAVLSVFFHRTRFGFAVRSAGANPKAAVLAGYRIDRLRVLVTALSGALCGVAGMLTLAYFGAADPSQGNGYEISVIAAAIIGGTSLVGGSGTVWGALLGALLISLIQASLIQFGVSANASYVVTGTVIVAAVGLDALIRRARARRRARA
jgi:ribose transport system permease protein